jgi:phage tail-like protein
MGVYFPPVGFHFRVEVLDLAPNDHDVRFKEVTGLEVELETEEVSEGGQNRFVQKFPTRTKYTDLVLKRGLTTNSELLDWVRSCLEDLEITPKNVDVMLLNEEGEPLLTWHLYNAYPTKWSVSDFDATANAAVIESLQLTYQYFNLDKG